MSAVISVPREEVFELLADLSRRPAFTDHYLKDFRLSRSNPRGRGAAARFLLARRIFAERAELSIAECDRPSRIVEQGRIGLRGRSSLSMIHELHEEPAGGTRVELSISSEPKTAVDRFRQRGLQRWVRRNAGKGLERLRELLEAPGADESARVTVAGYEPHTAPRFGDHIQARGKTAAADG